MSVFFYGFLLYKEKRKNLHDTIITDALKPLRWIGIHAVLDRLTQTDWKILSLIILREFQMIKYTLKI
ncbi:MAG TPA: hypothetical protein PLK41_08325 [Defluviitoga tunisiensis]|nr:hypothetical protein [Defluviitoga tunisiensis]